MIGPNGRIAEQNLGETAREMCDCPRSSHEKTPRMTHFILGAAITLAVMLTT